MHMMRLRNKANFHRVTMIKLRKFLEKHGIEMTKGEKTRVQCTCHVDLAFHPRYVSRLRIPALGPDHPQWTKTQRNMRQC